MNTATASECLPLSERLQEGLRNQNGDVFATTSPHAAALLVLIDALGIKSSHADISEALPHFSETFDITQLRNTLLLLGYSSEPRQWNTNKIDARFLPCLFGIKGKGLWVLLEKSGDSIRYYDSSTDNIQEISTNTPVSGTAYIFKPVTPPSTPHGQDKSASWSRKLLRRFRTTGLYLFAATFFIDIIALSVPLSIMFIYDKIIGGHSLDTLGYLVTGVIILFMIDLGLRNLRAKALGHIAGRLDYLIGVETLTKLLRLPPLFTEQSPVIAQLSRLKQFDGIRDFLTGNAAVSFMELPFSILGILVIAVIAGPLAWIPVVAVLLFLLMALISTSYLSEAQQQSGFLKSQKQSMLIQTIEGLPEIRNNGGEEIWLDRLRMASARAAHASYKNAFSFAAFTATGQLLSSLSILAVITWGAFMVIEGNLTSGGLIAVMAISWRLLTPLHAICLSIPQARQAGKSFAHIDQLMNLAEEHNSKHTGRLLDNIRGEICLRRVAFRYSPKEDPAVLGLSLKIGAGELIAITGASGSGKSTLLKLIAGMYQPQAGFITLDDIDIRQLDPIDLRRHIAYVPQNVKMFHGTIAQNLRLNNPVATHDDLEKALDMAGILDEVKKLPAGLETRMGDNLTRQFPPGFIHGLALARALARPAKILLLDEPAASLDMRTDRIFMRNLERMRRHYTIVMVTHRPSHIKLADRAVLLHEGCVRFAGEPDKAIAHLMEQLA